MTQSGKWFWLHVATGVLCYCHSLTKMPGSCRKLPWVIASEAPLQRAAETRRPAWACGLGLRVLAHSLARLESRSEKGTGSSPGVKRA